MLLEVNANKHTFKLSTENGEEVLSGVFSSLDIKEFPLSAVSDEDDEESPE